MHKYPNLGADSLFKINSPKDVRYNCIAYASNKTDAFWWPEKKDGVDWPFGLPYDNSVENFIRLFEKQQYTVCIDDTFEDGFQKIAIYGKDDNTGTHAAKQLFDGRWASKMGLLEDIVHTSPTSIEGPSYGHVKVIMKRPNSSFKLATAKHVKLG